MRDAALARRAKLMARWICAVVDDGDIGAPRPQELALDLGLAEMLPDGPALAAWVRRMADNRGEGR